MTMTDRLLLVVEGVNDKHVILAIVAHHRFQPEFTIRDEKGYEKLLQTLEARLVPGSDVERLGIVVDADIDAARRWQSLKGMLARVGYSDLPGSPDPAGTVVNQEDLPRVGVWIMPDNVVPGMLEDFLALLVPAGDALLDRARQAVDGIPPDERRFADVHRPKALIYTWLAWQKEPGKPPGQAITNQSFDADGPQVARFLGWLARVFA